VATGLLANHKAVTVEFGRVHCEAKISDGFSLVEKSAEKLCKNLIFYNAPYIHCKNNTTYCRLSLVGPFC
jgi:hypothetical protein